MNSYKKSPLLGALCVLVGIFLILVSLNVIQSPNSSFSSGRITVFLVAIDFIAIGLVTAFGGKNPPKTILGKSLVLLFFAFFLAPFHIAEYYIIKENDLFKAIGFGFFIGLFDLIILYAFVMLILESVKNKKNK